MQLSEIRTETRFITRTDTNTFSDADLNREANIAYKKIMLEILKVQGYRNLSGVQSTTDLVSSDGLVAGDNGFDGEYAFPADLLRPIRMEVQFDTAETPRPCIIYDQSENILSETDDDSLSGITPELRPVVRFFRNSFLIRPIKTTVGNITDGITIWYEAREDDMSADGDTPNFEASLHDLIPVMVAERFYLRHPSKRNVAVLSEKESLMKQLRSFYKLRIPMVKQLKPRQVNFA